MRYAIEFNIKYCCKDNKLQGKRVDKLSIHRLNIFNL
jgi:hypothetical protein